jgi:hypothetical protein
MDALIKTGRTLFAAAMAFFGVQCVFVAIGAGAQWPLAGPPWTQSHAIIAGLTGLCLLATAICIAIPWHGSTAATLLAAGILARALFLYLPTLLRNLHNPGPWTITFELLAMGGAALVIAGTFSTEPPANPHTLVAVGRYLFAASLIVFGVQHLMYAKFVGTLIPAWIPWHLFWAYATGIAFFAASASLFTQRLIQPIATLLATMFLLWVVVLHAPRVAASPHSGDEWTSAAVALAMGAASLIIAGLASSRSARSA